MNGRKGLWSVKCWRPEGFLGHEIDCPGDGKGCPGHDVVCPGRRKGCPGRDEAGVGCPDRPVSLAGSKPNR